jgi:hypothetical protein
MKLLFTLPLAVLLNCATAYSEKIQVVEESLYRGDFETAIQKIRSLVVNSDSKDRLLYLMEAGVVLRAKGDYAGSNKAFGEAEGIADTIQVSASREALSFALSDNESNFQGESFERVLIKFYMALNYLNMNDLDAAKRYFKKVAFEQKEMKFSEGSYKQNVMARYLDAIVSEHLAKYNDARVEYKNILAIEPQNKEALAGRYILAWKEGDSTDQGKFDEGKNYIQAYDKNLNSKPISNSMGELIVIVEAGKAAVKESRGKLMDDPTIATPLRGAIEATLRSDSQAGLSVGSVLAMIGGAENPIPIYKPRDPHLGKEVGIIINGKSIGQTQKMNDYSETAMNSFNENYSSIISKNITSIASKVVFASMAAYTAGESAKRSREKDDLFSDLIGMAVSFVSGLVAGAAISSSIAPDLRCWHTVPANFQMKRIFLEPGEYEINFETNSPSLNPLSQKITIEAGKPVFLNLRSF